MEKPNHSHAWKGAWDRPMKIDEDGLHPFTIARMTDHNVRGRDAAPSSQDAQTDLNVEIEMDRMDSEGGAIQAVTPKKKAA